MGQTPSLRERILEHTRAVNRRVIPAPQFGVEEVEVRELTAAGQDEWDEEYFSKEVKDEEGKTQFLPENRNLRARFLVRVLFDPETGERIFSNEDAEMLGQLPGQALSEPFRVARELNGLSVPAVEDEGKNSDGAPPDSSPTNSQNS